MKTSSYFRKFAAETLRTRLESFKRVIDEAGASISDPEYVHRLRVAGRRLRCALRAAGDCLPSGDVTLWGKHLRRLARRTGPLRDTDVQSAFLCAVMDAVPQASYRPGLRRLELRLRQRRARAAPRAARALRRLIDSGVMASMADALAGLGAQAAPTRPIHLVELRHRACTLLCERLSPCLAQAVTARDDQSQNTLHNLRIAVKKLRYSIEIFDPVYDGRLGDTAAALRELQHLLGHIHDMDVWLVYMRAFPARESERMQVYLGHSRPMSRLAPGLNYMRNRLLRERRSTLRKFQVYCDELDRTHAWEMFRGAIMQPMINTEPHP